MKKKELLFNKKSREQLKEELAVEPFDRITASFYAYTLVDDPLSFRNDLYLTWQDIGVFGRIYVADEGINAQLSVPERRWDDFIESMRSRPVLKDIPIKKAIQDGMSFYKLTIKVRKELVAYGIPEDSYDMRHVGTHLTAEEFNQALDNPDTTVVDMRNYYESEIGRFKTAVIPDVETSQELLQEVKDVLKGKEDEPVLLYCTGGIRCEKASSYLLKQGFKKVNQLQGGIIQYAHDVKEKGLMSKFIGKNFVFDYRLGERVTDDVIAECHICGATCDRHTDCSNDACHILFIQCEACDKELTGCCSKECQEFASLPVKRQIELRKDPTMVVSRTFFNSRVKPKLNSN